MPEIDPTNATGNVKIDEDGAMELDDGEVSALRGALDEAGYTVDGVRRLLGDRASAALDRNETTPSSAMAEVGSPLATMARLWPLQRSVAQSEAAACLPLGALVRAGIVRVVDSDTVRAAVDIRPYADESRDWWVFADLTPGLDGLREPVPDDHVLGVNAASSTLAQLTIRRPAAAALDLGTGCGVQALHLDRHCDRIVATDVNGRALAMAALTSRLNHVDVDLRAGSLYEPVADETFDLIVTNPPFVVSPGGHHVYRDSGWSGDRLTQEVVTGGARRLTPGGILQSLGNWMRVKGEDWQDRVGSWVSATGCDAWVIEREVLDPAEYVELWLRDAGVVGSPSYKAEYSEWLGWLDDNDVAGIGFGWINLRNSGASTPVVSLESWPHALEQPIGQTIGRWFERAHALPERDADLLNVNLSVADDLVQEHIGQPGAEDPEHVVLRQRQGLMRAITASTAQAGFVGACDGSLSVGVIIDALATVLDADGSVLHAELIPWIRDRVAEGYLRPVS